MARQEPRPPMYLRLGRTSPSRTLARPKQRRAQTLKGVPRKLRPLQILARRVGDVSQVDGDAGIEIEHVLPLPLGKRDMLFRVVHLDRL